MPGPSVFSHRWWSLVRHVEHLYISPPTSPEKRTKERDEKLKMKDDHWFLPLGTASEIPTLTTPRGPCSSPLYAWSYFISQYAHLVPGAPLSHILELSSLQWHFSHMKFIYLVPMVWNPCFHGLEECNDTLNEFVVLRVWIRLQLYCSGEWDICIASECRVEEWSEVEPTGAMGHHPHHHIELAHPWHQHCTNLDSVSTAILGTEFGYAGMNIITKVSLNRGMSHYVLVVYRHAFATAVIAPFALVLERPVIDQNFYYAGLKFTSPTFSCAMSNMLPAMTFVMAVLCRMEKLDMKKFRCQAKVVGTVVTVAGAMLMTLYKGPIVEMVWSKYVHPHNTNAAENSGSSDKDWLKGSILLIIATFAWASFFILQAITMRRYQAHLSLTSIVCFLGTLQSIAVTFVMEHRPSVWTIGWDMNLLAAAYAHCILCPRIGHAERGPVFVTAFSPLMMIIVAIMGSFILAEKIFLGGVIGAVLIVAGLYSVLWGKYKEFKEKEAETIPEAIKGAGENGGMKTVMEETEEDNDIEMQKSQANKLSTPAVAVQSVEAPKA
ncbi:WAT1-related protein [Vitis vinifera]|uniref:WAT1-related protein n=1 Tax=Vitis vinifera TaxID=29760 RepID=A0A438BXX4_VITVI|nr:WAT1-related protein [Vitis vinifera]